MAVIKRSGPRRGLSTGGAKVDTTKVSYTVVKDVKNAMKIAGKRRQKGDVFMAIPRHVYFLVLEGVIAPTPAASSASASTATGASSSSSASSASSSSSSSSVSSSSSSSSSATTSSKSVAS